MSLPFLNTAPERTSATRWGASTARHRVCADSMSSNAIATPAAREPGPLVTRWRSLTVAKVGEGARRAGRTRLCPDGRRLAGQGPHEPQRGRGRRQWGATLKALRRGNSCAAGHSPRSCASLGGRPRPQRSLTPADRRAQPPRPGGGAAPCPNDPDPGRPPRNGATEVDLRPRENRLDRSDPRKPPPHRPRALDIFIRGAQVDPVVGGVVVEGQQHVEVVGDL